MNRTVAELLKGWALSKGSISMALSIWIDRRNAINILVGCGTLFLSERVELKTTKELIDFVREHKVK